MFLHLARDEKFINSARALFDSVTPDPNLFIISTDTPEQACTYIHKTDHTLVVSSNPRIIGQLIDSREDVDALVVHGIDSCAAEAITLLKRRLPILWLAWGFDVYDVSPTLGWHLYQPRTLEYVSKRWPIPLNRRLPMIARRFLNRLAVHRSLRYRTQLRAIKACAFCAPVFPTENEIIRRHWGFKGEFLRFSYGDYADEADRSYTESIAARNILVGNSASSTSNHVDAFEILSRLRLGDRKIIVPLSYGGTDDYRTYVIKAGNSVFGRNFLPIVDFMSLKDYSALVKTCGIYLLYHMRQQAGGNIVMGLWNGARIFLPEGNPGYKYFRGLGAEVFSLNRELNQGSLDRPFDLSTVERNRTVVRREYGPRAVLERVRKVVATLHSAAQNMRSSVQ